MAVKIITDSACDLPKEYIESLNIDVMPLIVYLDDKEYEDGNIDPHEFFEGMRQGLLTRTAQIPASTLKSHFESYINDEDDILYISFSSGLSGTYQTAELVKSDLLEEHPNLKLSIIDSKSASIGFGLIVYYAARLAEANETIETIVEKTNFYIEHIEHIFTVDDLEYLYRGGRVSRGAAVMGSMLNIKPILDIKDGKLVPLTKIRGRKKALSKMISLVGERGDQLEKQIVAINHGDDIETALELKKIIEEKYGVKEFIINYVGCAIGAHSGPGTLSIFFLNQLN